MWAVYICGPTDCFLNAMFIDQDDADQWLKDNCLTLEGGFVKLFTRVEDIDISDTGWPEEPLVKI